MTDVRTNYKEALDEFLTCFICNSRFNTQGRRPLALFCGHTFCGSCVPHFKMVFGQLNCPIDHINEVRPAASIPCNLNLLNIVKTMEIYCLFHPTVPADYYCLDTVEPFCEDCLPHFANARTEEMRNLSFPDFLVEKVTLLMGEPGMQQKLGRYPNLAAKVNTVRNLLNSDKQILLFNLQNVNRNLDPNTQRQLPALPAPKVNAPTHFRLIDGSTYEITRFRRVVPPVIQATEESKQWWISNNGHQVDAVVVWSSTNLSITGIGLGKEVVAGPGKRIDYVDVLRGTSTQGPSLFREYVNTLYSGPDPQIMTLNFSRAVVLRPNEKITIKVKQTGTGLYYGDPSARVEPLQGPGDVVFYFDDPTYEGGDFQNGQSKWAGPIIRLYFTLNR